MYQQREKHAKAYNKSLLVEWRSKRLQNPNFVLVGNMVANKRPFLLWYCIYIESILSLYYLGNIGVEGQNQYYFYQLSNFRHNIVCVIFLEFFLKIKCIIIRKRNGATTIFVQQLVCAHTQDTSTMDVTHTMFLSLQVPMYSYIIGCFQKKVQEDDTHNVVPKIQ